MSMNPVILILLVFLAESTINVRFGNGDSKSNILCIEREKQALLSFKGDLVDDSNTLMSWDVSEEEDCCKWDGIVCNSITGHVAELRLNNISLTGKINPSLLNLTHLSHLDLSSNDFGDINIPSFMGSLVSLRYLNLTYGGFKGMIPHQLGNLSSLRYLGLGNYLGLLYADKLHWISGLSSLEYLDINCVDLSVISDNWFWAINTLPSLLDLCLSDCDLPRIRFPSHINVTSLERLDLSYNSLQLENSIPCSFWNNMSHLKYLDLTENKIGSIIPSCFYSFPNLEHLHLSGNELHGVISSAIANLTSLVSLDLSYNALVGNIPTSIGNLCNLEDVDLSNNRISEKVSDAFERLSGCLSNKLKSLHLNGKWIYGDTGLYADFGNSFTGQIPDEIGGFKNLVELSLRGNNIFGPIPASIFGKLLSLKILDIGYNKLTGFLPESFGSLTKLEFLDLSNNQLNGSIPKSLGSLSNLKHLDLSKNQLNRPLPKSLGSLSNLEVLDISSNHLEGDVSEAHFANLTNLMTILASENQLTLRVSPYWIPPFQLDQLELRFWNLGCSQFPMWLRLQKHISILDLSNTGISDAIPSWFWNLSTTSMIIDLSRNQIHGEIPDFHHLSYSFSIIYLSSNKLKGLLPRISAVVEVLDLSNNSLSGDMSSFLCDPKADSSRLLVLNLANNFLSGRIPDCWMYWPSLEVIDLDNNNLNGKIPSSMGSLRSLTSLHLRNNSLNGEITKPVQNCSSLIGLNLGLNNFVGTIPRWIGSLLNLKFLVLRSNQLTGHVPIELCALTGLQVLDAGNNNLSGTIPKCFKNFASMITKSLQLKTTVYLRTQLEKSGENAILVIKGREDQYESILYLVTSLDLSSNNLSGEIPKELANLQALQCLNLSGNYLSGSIPKKIGNMTVLESLDLSRNQLSGKVPPGMSSLTFLNHLNLSYNNLSGEIPTSTQLQSFEASSFIGNQLCGPPLPNTCNANDNTTPGVAGIEHEESESEDEEFWFRLGIGMGFGVGFVGVIAPLLMCGFWRHAYFWFFQEYLWYNILDCCIKFKRMLRS